MYVFNLDPFSDNSEVTYKSKIIQRKSENLEKYEDIMQLMLIKPWKFCVMILALSLRRLQYIK